MNVLLDCEGEPRRYAEEYESIPATGTSYLDFRDINELVGKYVKGKETLDYGCGPGRSSVFLKSLGLSVTGVDINEHMIKCARENDVNGRYELITSGNVPADNNTYDLVFSSWVMVRVSTKSELHKIGQEIHRVLKPHGIFIMIVGSNDTYNKNWLTVKNDFAENQILHSGSRATVLFKDTNLKIFDYFWTEEDYKEMIESSNMTILEIHRPLGKDTDGYDWNLEKFISPVYIYVAQKN